MLADGKALACTVSIGVSGILIDPSHWQTALRQAALALRAAKSRGRERVETAPTEASEPGPTP